MIILKQNTAYELLYFYTKRALTKARALLVLKLCRVPTSDEHRLTLFPPGQSEIASFLSLKLQEQRRFRCVHLLVLLFSKPTREHRLARFISVALSTSSRCPEFLRRSVLECTDFPHLIFLKRDYPAALLSLIYHKLPVLPV